MAADNNTLGVFRLEGIPSAPRGIPQVEVTFDIDANGILNVSAKDRATGRQQAITITASTNLTESDIDRMVREAEQNAAVDQKRRELIEARNMADQLVYQTEKNLLSLNGQVPSELKFQVENKLNTLKEALNGEDSERIQQLSAELQQAAMALGQAVHHEGNSAGDGTWASGRDDGQANEDDVVEGEFETI
jgi:molecular chaperone DnaK